MSPVTIATLIAAVSWIVTLIACGISIHDAGVIADLESQLMEKDALIEGVRKILSEDAADQVSQKAKQAVMERFRANGYKGD